MQEHHDKLQILDEVSQRCHDSNNKYTIGVLVIRAKKKNAHYASRSAVPVFREIVKEMVKEGILAPE